MRRFFLLLFLCVAGVALAESDSEPTNYRGKRAEAASKGIFRVEKVIFTEDEMGTALTVFFSMQVNPSSLKHEFFVVNKKPASEKTGIRCSKSALSVKLRFPKNFEIHSLEIFGLESYDGKKVQPFSSGALEKKNE